MKIKVKRTVQINKFEIWHHMEGNLGHVHAEDTWISLHRLIQVFPGHACRMVPLCVMTSNSNKISKRPVIIIL